LGPGTRRAQQVRLLRKRATQLLAYGVGVVSDLTTHVCMPGVELLCQALRQGLMLGVQIPPGGLLRPECQDTQERRGQGGLLALRKPRLT
jgi:hypothetical protein